MDPPRLPKVYLETTILGYLAARPSRDLVVAAHQELTFEWWTRRRSGFDLHCSELVIEEASLGDGDTSRRRLALLEGVRVLRIDDRAKELADRLLESGCLPHKARVDALHIAIAAVGSVDFLLTWNCRHIANVQSRSSIDCLCREQGHEPPLLCTPQELMGR